MDEFYALVASFITRWGSRSPEGRAKLIVEVESKSQDARRSARPCLTGAVSTVMLRRPYARPTLDSM